MAGLSTRKRAEGCSWVLAIYRVTGNPLVMAAFLVLATSSIVWTFMRPSLDARALAAAVASPSSSSARPDATSLISRDEFDRAVRRREPAAAGTRSASRAGGGAGEAGTKSGNDGPAAVESSAAPKTPRTPPETEERHELEFQPGVLDAIKSLPPFPKIVHYIWNDKNILDKNYQMLEHGAKRLRSLSPGWEFRVHDDGDIRRKLESFTHPDVPGEFWDQLRDAHIVEQTDAFRLITIYETGGLYVDIDRVANVDLNAVIPDGARMVLPTYYDINFCQDLFGSSPGNGLILNVLGRQTELKADFRRINGWIRSSDHLEITHMFSRSLETDLFGPRRVHRKELWDAARHLLRDHTGGAVVTAKDEWCDGLLITDYPGCKGVSRSDLYSDYGVKGWAGEVDKLFEDAEKKEKKSGRR